jgi:undecaprenyl-diphosphatase
VTEYLPVSSTGHLLLAERALGLPRSVDLDAFTIAIQLGAIVAVLGLYAGRVRGVARGLLGRDPSGLRLARTLLVAFVPAAAVGLLAEGWIERHLYGLWPIVVAWFVGGVAILLVSWRRRGRPVAPGLGLETMTLWMALGIGFAQCAALWPGTSRSLVSIVGGVLVGLRLAAAVEFSFLLGVLTLGAATGWKLLRHGDVMLERIGPAALAVGFVASAVTAALAVVGFVRWLERRGLAVFGVYRVALAVVVAILLVTRVLPG